MFPLFSKAIFATQDFNKYFGVTTFVRVQAFKWIRRSALPEAQRIVSVVVEKAKKRSKNPLEVSTINCKIDKVLCKLLPKHVSQAFRTALAIQTYANRDKSVRNYCRSTFKRQPL